MSLVAIPNIAALRQQDPSINNSIFVMGANTINDGGAGMYIFVPSSGAVDNGTTIIRSLSAQGCWFLNLANNPSGSQPTDGTFILVSPDASLPNSRTIVAGSGITIVDGGAGGSLTISSSGGISTATLPLIITASNIALGTAVGPTTPDATSSVTWSPSGAASAGLVLQAKSSQSVPIMEIQTSTGVVCFSLPVPITTLTGSDNNLIGIGAGSILSSGNSNNIIGTAAGGGIQTGISNTIIGNNAGSSGSAGSMSSTTMIGSNAGLANTANQNTFLGAQCGISNTSGTGQAFFGYAAGASVTGSDNSIFGADAGDSFTTGARNCLFGKDAGGAAGATSMSDTVMVGYRAGLLNTANQNTYVGSGAGATNTSNTGQSFFGYQAGNAATGSNNTYLGFQSGYRNSSGAQNVVVGSTVGSAVSTYNSAVIIGYGAGVANTSDGPVFIGANAGAANAGNTGAVYIGVNAGQSATGANNTIVGYTAGDEFTTGARNCLFGASAGGAAGTAMSDNAFFGYQAGLLNTASQNTFFGSTAGNAVTTGTLNTLVGYNSDVAATTDRATALGANTTAITDSTAIGSGSDASFTTGLFVCGSTSTPMDQVYFGKGRVNASATEYTINGTGGSGSDNAGANLQLAGGKGTGIANPGLVVLKYPLRLATGSTLQSLSAQSYPVSTTMFTGNISNVTVTASVVGTTETTLLGTIAGSQSLEGGMLRAGRSIRIYADGVYTSSGAPPSITIRIKIGSVTISARSGGLLSVTQTDRAWYLDTTINCRTIGASGTLAGGGVCLFDATGLSAIMNQTLSTVDTTSTANVDLTITWAANTAGNSITCTNFVVEIRN